MRTYDFAEADRVIVLLTRTHGLVRAVAKGVRKSKSRFGSRLQPFVDVDVQVYPPRTSGLATITAADTVAYYGRLLIDDFDRYTTACAIMETAEKLAFDDADPALFDLVADALASVQTSPQPTLVLDAFMLQATQHAGWGLALFNCAQCEAPGPHTAFNAAAGGAVCTRCRPPGSADVHTEVLHAMWLLQHGHQLADQPANQPADQPAQLQPGALAEQIHRLTTAHLQFNLEAGLKTLRIMEQA